MVARRGGEETDHERPGAPEGERGADPPHLLRYEDDRKVCFVPEAGEEFFSQDDAHRLVGMLHKGSEALEWGLSSSQRHPSTGPYDTGAV